MPQPWPALTEDTAALRRLARRLLSSGAPVQDLQRLAAGQADDGLAGELAKLPLPPALARAWLIGMLHELGLARELRRSQGAYYTPRGIAKYMLNRALACLRDPAGAKLQFLDPAAGSGAFLLSALEVWNDRQPDLALHLTGCDLDASALASADLALAAANVDFRGSFELSNLDSLLDDPPLSARGYDIVAGNPPYLDSERISRLQPDLRRVLRQRYRTARGNWDLSCVFIERALELARPGGVAAMLVPRKLFAADYASALHSLLLEHELVEVCSLAGVPVFQAGVEAAVVIVRRRRSQQRPGAVKPLFRSAQAGPPADHQVPPDLLRALPPGFWCAAFWPDARRIAKLLHELPPLEQFAEVGDGCSTAEAYQLEALVRDAAGGTGPPLVNTGLIKPFVSLWGGRELAYLKQRYRYPRLDAARLEKEFPKRWRQAQTPKLLLPGLARDLWAVADHAGEWACGKGAVQVLPVADSDRDVAGLPLLAWLAWLNSAPLRRLYRTLFGGRGFSESSLHIGPRQLKRLPVPIAGLQAHAADLAALAQTVQQQQQAGWQAALATARGRSRLRAVNHWQDCQAAARINEIITSAYGWPEPT